MEITLNKKQFTVLFLTMIIFILTSCSFSTEPSKGSLAGTITLEGESDHSGITIALYDLITLDPEIVSINNEYPQIGIHISQHTEFDHRFESPVKYTETATDGNFELTKMSTGRYNLVAIKDGWGFKYLYEIEISKGDNGLSQQIILFEEQHISGNIQENITVETDHHLIIDNDAVFQPNISSLIIHPGAIIRINPGVDLAIHSVLNAQGEENNMFWVTSNDGVSQNLIVNTNNRDEIIHYNSMELFNTATVENNLIEWGKWDNGNICFLNQTSDFAINNTSFSNANCGIYFTNSSNCSIIGSRFSTITNASMAGIVLDGEFSSNISDNIFTNNYNAILPKNKFSGLIKRNVFSANEVGIEFYHFLGTISNNEFLNSSQADIRFTGNMAYEDIGFSILYNEFHSDIGIYAFYNHSFSANFSYFYINNNNFYNNNWFIFIQTSGIIFIVNATNNFFNYYTNELDIRDKIYSHEDNPISAEIDISNFHTSPISGAGLD